MIGFRKRNSKIKLPPLNEFRSGIWLATSAECETFVDTSCAGPPNLLRFVLSEAGYDVTCTDDPHQAVFLAHNKPFDLILVDNWLPGTSGPELTRSLRKIDVNTPILFYSGAGYESDKEAARAGGAQGYLVKPVLNEDLINEVTRLSRRITECCILAMTSSPRGAQS